MDAVVQLIRNALCCVKDLELLQGTFLWDSSVTLLYYNLPEPLHKTTPLEVFISISQLYACISASVAGFRMILQSWGKFRRIERLMGSAKKSSSSDVDRIVQESLNKEGMLAIRSMFIGINVLFIGLSFFWLFANSWHVTETEWIGGVQGLIHALTVMEICLLPLLYYMLKDGAEQFTKASRMEDLASRMKSPSTKLTAKDMGVTSLDVLSDWKPFWSSGVDLLDTHDTSTEDKQMEVEKQMIVKVIQSIVGKEKDEDKKGVSSAELSERADELLADAKITRLEGYREYLYFVINLVAFYGYLVGILVYYFNNEEEQPTYVRKLLLGMNNSDADWHGNFAGDLMWTIEPAIILSSPIMLGALKPKKKVKAD